MAQKQPNEKPTEKRPPPPPAPPAPSAYRACMDNVIMRKALERIAKWHGEFPPTGQFWDAPANTLPMSYGACYGSDGERDYMRSVAQDALAASGDGRDLLKRVAAEAWRSAVQSVKDSTSDPVPEEIPEHCVDLIIANALVGGVES